MISKRNSWLSFVHSDNLPVGPLITIKEKENHGLKMVYYEIRIQTDNTWNVVIACLVLKTRTNTRSSIIRWYRIRTISTKKKRQRKFSTNNYMNSFHVSDATLFLFAYHLSNSMSNWTNLSTLSNRHQLIFTIKQNKK